MPHDSTKDEASNFKFTWIEADHWLQDQRWWDIYLNSFPENERDTKEQIHSAVTQGLAQIGRFCLNNVTQAITVIYSFSALPITYLHYFAIDRSFRGQGVGGKLLQNLISYADQLNIQRHNKSMGLLWEIEDPLAATSEQERELRLRRVAFYEKQNAFLLPKPFIQPPIQATADDPLLNSLPMRLMYASNETEFNLIEHEKNIAQTVYQEKYQKVNATPAALVEHFLQICHQE